MNSQFENLAYCCIPCDERCKAFRATINDDYALKSELARQWSTEDNADYKPEQVECYGCKDKRDLLNRRSKCTVRACAIEKGMKKL